MKTTIIAHRANLYGPNPNTENTLEAIQDCIKRDIDMELDIWHKDGKFFLGHDEPRLEFDPFTYNFGDSYVWFHCKTIQTIEKLLTNTFYTAQKWYNQYTVFFHDKDDMTLTSNQEFWTYPGRDLCVKSIAVMPEYVSHVYEGTVLKLMLTHKLKGVCTDYPLEWITKMKEMEKIYE